MWNDKYTSKLSRLAANTVELLKEKKYRCEIRALVKSIKINTWREDKFERSVANGTETVFVTLRFCVVRKQLKATLKPNAAGVQLPPHYYRNG